MNGYVPLLVGLALVASAPLPLAAAEVGPRTVTASGSGEVRSAPDQATVTLGVSARAPTIAEARARVNKGVPTLLNLARDLKVADSSVRSTELAVNPEYGWDEKRTVQHLVGYRFERRIVVDMKDIEHLGELLEKSVSLGANILNEPELDSSHRKDLERQALALAVADARRNAEVLAIAGGGTVGPAREISMAGTQAPRERAIYAAAPMLNMAPGQAPATYRVGELAFSAAVEATFDLLPAAAAH